MSGALIADIYLPVLVSFFRSNVLPFHPQTVALAKMRDQISSNCGACWSVPCFSCGVYTPGIPMSFVLVPPEVSHASKAAFALPDCAAETLKLSVEVLRAHPA